MSCNVCKQSDCPCEGCHGQPKRWLGHIARVTNEHAIVDPNTGTVTCVLCGTPDQGFYDSEGRPYLKH